MRYSTLATTLSSVAAVALCAPRSDNLNALEKRFDGARMTWFHPGLGSCGVFNTDADHVVALNAAQWDNRVHCNQNVVISINGITTTAVITDLCPSCPFGGLDLSPGLFQMFGSLDVGVLSGSWNFL
ncbi:plant expansin [Panaeolus papilionaceus]|nr:plant expansin [Panaeolus papilionaceus]